ncbi:parallel beta-helix domain-containing protein [Alkalimarinus sediminis]|uniref:Right-handed parallel beta-helix repeat-containing protein n=1 Tax=Alkalimarinus sediminis TaxID=1632866 RepID=A0A9E8KJF0_9ALTE|nr:parallel beta-helix domain-containing protein [Alkalimarinus sediminis]UZW74976.1 right-handed parallel beta-helix repeat-containing protein [Alkalimarinus sediminis]
MNTSQPATPLRKALLCAAISSSILLSGCKIKINDDDVDKVTDAVVNAGTGTGGGNVEVPVADPSKVSTSGFVFPADAIYVAPDAKDGDDITNQLLLALFEVADDAVVVMPQGTFTVSETITVAATNGVTLTGYGINETKLNFLGATGDDAFRFEGGNDITIRDFGVYEANKNGIKVVGANGIHIAYTATVWEGPLEANNGAYGLYPLQSQNILMEHNYAYGSADAGIYVGQSNNIVVRDNTAKNNVAGIEIENSTMADVYNNLAVGNAAGILAFDLPGLEQGYGGNVRIFSNDAYANNADNVGSGAVGIAPPGTGVLIFAVSDVEIYNNNLTDNETSAIELASYFLADPDVANYPTNYGSTMANGWSPLVKNIYMHDNLIARNGGNPRGALLTDVINGYQLGANAKGTPQVFPAIIYDGIGELLANAGAIGGFNALVGPTAAADGVNYDPYGVSDNICANNNINGNPAPSYDDVNTGLVYGTNPADPANWNAGGTEPVPTLLIDQMVNHTYLNCVQNRLPPAEVTFKGRAYGCTGDDLAEQACSL